MEIIISAMTVLFILNCIILYKLLSRKDFSLEEFENRTAVFSGKLDEFAGTLSREFSDNRREYSVNFLQLRREMGELFTRFTSSIEQRTDNLQNSTAVNLKANRDELSGSLKSFEQKLQVNITELNRNTGEKLELIRSAVDNRLTSIQKDNNDRLEQMRQTVDEKLHATLERRLGESFRLVSDRLEAVQKGLGEMQNLASGVGDLKKVLSNVKSKGVIGEYQLEALLEQLLTRQQYDKNVKTKKGSRDNVEYAIKMPDKNTEDGFIWLPIDAKFPTEDYEKLQNAYDAGDKTLIEDAVKSLSTRIDKFAKDIHDKYVDPPQTTDFAVMFLPFEGLYAEVLRIPGLFEKIQKNYKIAITGPTTLSALLNSLQMGFKSLAIEKRSVEVWQVLGAVKTEFGKFGAVLDQAKKKLDAARDELDKTDTRTKKINSKLKNIESLPSAAADTMLDMEISTEDEDE